MPQPPKKTNRLKDKKERVLADGPFAIKWMSREDKVLAWGYCDRHRETMNEFIAVAIRERVQRERAMTQTGEIIRPGFALATRPGAEARTPDTEPRPPGTALALIDQPPERWLSAEEISRTIDLAQTIAKLRGTKLKPNAKLLISAERLLRQRLAGG